MKRLFFMAMTSAALTLGTPAGAGEPVPETFPFVGGHLSRYQLDPEAWGGDFIDHASLPGLQGGYRFPGGLSVQAWWERNNTRVEKTGREVDFNLVMGALRFHTPKLYLGVEPYAGLGAGEIMYETHSDENDESFMSLELGLQNRIRTHWLLDIGARAPYSFDDDRWDTEFYFGLNHIFGVEPAGGSREEKQDVPLVAPQPTLRDTDRDGVPDTVDECPGTPAGSRVDNTGCPATNP